MPRYNPDELLISIHVPKCAGSSFAESLRQLFGERLHLHYPDLAEPGPPPRLTQTAGHCVHGHFFHHEWKIGACDYYPMAQQFITVLRDPLEMMISSYHYQRLQGHAPHSSLTAYLEHVLSWPVLFAYRNLPIDIWKDDALAQVKAKFLWIGITERLTESLPLLCQELAAPLPELPTVNVAPRTERLAERCRWEAAFRSRFPAEYRLYDYAVTRLDNALQEDKPT